MWGCSAMPRGGEMQHYAGVGGGVSGGTDTDTALCHRGCSAMPRGGVCSVVECSAMPRGGGHNAMPRGGGCSAMPRGMQCCVTGGECSAMPWGGAALCQGGGGNVTLCRKSSCHLLPAHQLWQLVEPMSPFPVLQLSAALWYTLG